MENLGPLLVCSLLAALASSAGTLPMIGRERLPRLWLGWANAAAAGLMLGAAHVLAVESLHGDALQWTGGAVLGVLFVYGTHRFAGTAELDLNVLDHPKPEYGSQVLTLQVLHSGSEGVAIGVAAVIDLRFAIFMAFVLAIHNIAEAMVLAAVLRRGSDHLARVAGQVVAATMSQVVLAMVTFGVLSVTPALLQVTLGFAVGTFVYLVMVELLPEAYRQAGYPSIAVLTSLTCGVIALLEGVVL